MSDGLRARKKSETRQALSSAALRLADAHGPDRVTVEAIADAAGVSPRTFFNYFPSKDDAIVGLGPVESSTLLRALRARPTGEAPLEALRAAVQSLVDTVVAGAADWRVRHRLFDRHPDLAARHTARFGEVERSMAEEVARRTGLDVGRDIYPALAVGAALTAIRVTIAVWLAQDEPASLAALFDDAFDQLAAGLVVGARPALATAPSGT